MSFPLVDKYVTLNRKLYLEVSKITRGNLSVFQLLVSLGANIFQKDHWNRNLLHIAYYNKHDNIIKYLIDYGINKKQLDYFSKMPYEYYNFKNRLYA